MPSSPTLPRPALREAGKGSWPELLNRTQETGQVKLQGHPPVEAEKQELVLFTRNKAKGYVLLLKWGEFSVHLEDNIAG